MTQRGYYNNIVFHRVIRNFMIQGGDPTGTGRGGEAIFPGGKFDDEIDGRLKHTGAGILSMANSGPGTNGSQFFLVYKDSPLPPSYTPFGKITSGLDVLTAIAAKGSDNSNATGDGKPNETVTITSVTTK